MKYVNKTVPQIFESYAFLILNNFENKYSKEKSLVQQLCLITMIDEIVPILNFYNNIIYIVYLLNVYNYEYTVGIIFFFFVKM